MRNATEYADYKTRPLTAEVRTRLENLRLSRRWTYKHLASLIGFHYSTLYRGLNGKPMRAIDIAAIEQFMEGLHV